MFTERDKEIAKAIDGKYKYMARDEDGSLWLYERKPIKNGAGYWAIDWEDHLGAKEKVDCRPNVYFPIGEVFFLDVQWKDSEPTRINEIYDVVTETEARIAVQTLCKYCGHRQKPGTYSPCHNCGIENWCKTLMSRRSWDMPDLRALKTQKEKP